MNIDSARNNLALALEKLAQYSEEHEYDEEIDKIYEFVQVAQNQLHEQAEKAEMKAVNGITENT
ncbi:MAG: hypothetical protein KME40_32490 [Komarekiella atlantica HA4396-MV6]|jgi:hypothetical protein|nr:hypothetical protein [Komarekiella atlantica HA4396-MV6]